MDLENGLKNVEMWPRLGITITTHHVYIYCTAKNPKKP